MSSIAVRATAPGRPAPSRRGEWRIHVILVVAAALMVVPFVWEILASFKTNAEVSSLPPTILPEQPSVRGYATFFDSVPFWAQFGVSAASLVMRVVGQVLVAALAGYAFARLRFPGRNLLFVIFLLMLMVPSQLFLLGQFEIIRDVGLLNTIPALAIPGIFSAFGTFLMRQAFITMPREYEEAARLDGAGPVRTFWSVMLPMARPTVAALAVLTSLYSWNDLLWPLIVTPTGDARPLPVGLASMQGQFGTDYPALMAGALICTVPLVLVFLFLQRQFFAGIASSGLKG
ncbi:carbohydrate ABC transporter permease [Myceligenerans pegani]|uniref:Carbohydrate ABC transporter permease n=1 Tax=Myceligenerans pegani TaxID=2776917 RepID=A0ABR9MVF2_9MICO|nr:carbohydrate ABC transporter permease [Myceligenerans sp. TRM 65318]MBE1875368.1 carbohydrate ABC transporter permease [Myceligenerans sp. TRM 65318]MBE3017639.1 carbohydrate ABC transporter permease [Myceligenerans sp. TRM 65318]